MQTVQGRVRVTVPPVTQRPWSYDATNSDAYMVQRCVQGITGAGWVNLGTVTEPKYEGNGVIPGQKY